MRNKTCFRNVLYSKPETQSVYMDTESLSTNKYRLLTRSNENEISTSTLISESPSTYFETKPGSPNDAPESPLYNSVSPEDLSPYSITDHLQYITSLPYSYSELESQSPFSDFSYEPNTPSPSPIFET